MSVIYSPSDPARPIDWRYRRAIQIVDARQCIPLQSGDPEVAEIARYLRVRTGGTIDATRRRLADHMPNLDGAFRIHESRDTSVCNLLEAYLLTGQSHAAISEEFDVTPGVVASYASAFFDVASRLEQKTFIFSAVLFANRNENNSAVYLKLIAYLEGAASLDDLVKRSRIRGTEELRNLLREESEVLLLQKATQIVRESDVRDHRTAAELLNAYIRRETANKTSEQQPSRLMEHLQAMFTSLPLNMRGREPNKVPPEIRKFQTSTAELSYSELLQVSAGQTLENEDELLAITFPPRPTVIEQTEDATTLTTQAPFATPPVTPAPTSPTLVTLPTVVPVSTTSTPAAPTPNISTLTPPVNPQSPVNPHTPPRRDSRRPLQRRFRPT